MHPKRLPTKSVFPQVLNMRLTEDACLRIYLAQLREALEAAQAATREAQASQSLLPRLLGVMGHKRPEPKEIVEAQAREKEVQQRYDEVDQVFRRYTADLDTLIAVHLQETMPEYGAYSVARTRLAEWEQMVEKLRASERAMLVALGQARNAATSGYNKNKHEISETAVEQFVIAIERTRATEAQVKLVNAKAREIGGLPEISFASCLSKVKALPNQEFNAMHAQIDRLSEMLEKFEQEQITAVKDGVMREAALRESQARAYLEQYREELRAYSNKQIKPGEVTKVVTELLARQQPT